MNALNHSTSGGEILDIVDCDELTGEPVGRQAMCSLSLLIVGGAILILICSLDGLGHATAGDDMVAKLQW